MISAHEKQLGRRLALAVAALYLFIGGLVVFSAHRPASRAPLTESVVYWYDGPALGVAAAGKGQGGRVKQGKRNGLPRGCKKQAAPRRGKKAAPQKAAGKAAAALSSRTPARNSNKAKAVSPTKTVPSTVRSFSSRRMLPLEEEEPIKKQVVERTTQPAEQLEKVPVPSLQQEPDAAESAPAATSDDEALSGEEIESDEEEDGAYSGIGDSYVVTIDGRRIALSRDDVALIRVQAQELLTSPPGVAVGARVVVRVEVGTTGQTARVTLVRSSGSTMFDGMVRSSLRTLLWPAVVRGMQFYFTIEAES
jgi:outer membrane biosynthesis protein TonB